MSYQVLARKWRPRDFESLVGQDHVVRALRHALDERRLHHAWLFTGTRGVGKTTLSRILAKCLNCIGPDGQGEMTSRPCGVCRPCFDIDAGRFVDYIEMDAASNRGVDEMAAVLEQAVYAPANARFKVYMIDEVHMLTSHAFNAMLKTLEEPPAHVKFILATTDPQKIPVTVLSRCLQFNLKQMTIGDIASHLAHMLDVEGVPYEPPALTLLGRAAAGSMRDAQSLTDQAIAYGAGEVGEATVRGMLGALDRTYLLRILDALAEADGAALMTIVDEIGERSLSFGNALQDLGVLLHRVALVQALDAPADAADGAAVDADDAHLRTLAALLSPEDVQLWYQIAAHGRRDLSLAPDETTGFSMTLLRMLAFRIDDGAAAVAAPAAAVPRAPRRAPQPAPPGDAVDRPPVTEAEPPRVSTRLSSAQPVLSSAQPAPSSPAAASSRPANAVPAPSRPIEAASAPSRPIDAAPAPARPVEETPSPLSPIASAPVDSRAPSPPLAIEDWVAVVDRLGLTGLTRELVQQTELVAHDERSITLRVPIKSLLSGPAQQEKLRAALARHFGRPVAVKIEVGAVTGTTVASTKNEERAARQADAQALIAADPFVQAVVRDFGGATIVPGSIKPA